MYIHFEISYLNYYLCLQTVSYFKEFSQITDYYNVKYTVISLNMKRLFHTLCCINIVIIKLKMILKIIYFYFYVATKYFGSYFLIWPHEEYMS